MGIIGNRDVGGALADQWLEVEPERCRTRSFYSVRFVRMTGETPMSRVRMIRYQVGHSCLRQSVHDARDGGAVDYAPNRCMVNNPPAIAV